jgi:hypothetical protein
VHTNTPEPLTPKGCDLTGSEFTAVDHNWLLNSSFQAESTGDEYKAGLTLLIRSHQQIPAASVPNNDRVLASWCQVSLREWQSMKARVLAGLDFVLCSDDRYYCSRAAAFARSQWVARLESRLKSARANEKQHGGHYGSEELGRLLEDAERFSLRFGDVPTGKKKLSRKELPRSPQTSQGIGSAKEEGANPLDSHARGASEYDDDGWTEEFGDYASIASPATAAASAESGVPALVENVPPYSNRSPRMQKSEPSYPPEFEAAWVEYLRKSPRNKARVWRAWRDHVGSDAEKLAALRLYNQSPQARQAHKETRDAHGYVPNMEKWVTDCLHDWLSRAAENRTAQSIRPATPQSKRPLFKSEEGCRLFKDLEARGLKLAAQRHLLDCELGSDRRMIPNTDRLWEILSGKRTVKNNPELAKLVEELEKLGVKFDDQPPPESTPQMTR